jgi:uncharacterized membrane protein
MDLKVFFGMLLTLVPGIELRGGLPLALHSVFNDGALIISLVFLVIVLINIIIIFVFFFFLDYFHQYFLNIQIYKKIFDKNILRIQKKVRKIEGKTGIALFIALAFVVAIPLPGTGAYTGTLIAWLLKLERNKSIVSISLGVFVAGIIILIGSLGLFRFFL